jgi:hypothetical protein
MQSMLLAQKSQKSKLLDIRFYEMESTSRSLTDRISTDQMEQLLENIFATGRIRLTGSLAGCHQSPQQLQNKRLPETREIIKNKCVLTSRMFLTSYSFNWPNHDW